MPINPDQNDGKKTLPWMWCEEPIPVLPRAVFTITRWGCMGFCGSKGRDFAGAGLQYIAWQHDISVSACTELMIASQWSVLRERRCLGALAKSRLANSRRQHCVRLA